jgi:hypothetical protein
MNKPLLQKSTVLFLILICAGIYLLSSNEYVYADTWRNRTINSSSPGCIDDTAGDTNPNDDDTDKDGICDKWEGDGTQTVFDPDWPSGETYSVSCSSIDGCPVLGVKDIYLEIDYMDGHIPDLAAINLVKEAFAAQTDPPYRLHVIIDERALPHMDTTRFPGFNTQTGWGFDQVKQCHFGTPSERVGTTSDPQCGWANPANRLIKKAIFHYALFVHAQAANPTSSGIAEVFGNDIMISLGSFTGGVGSTDEQAGTLMHELGHNLRLNHGGGEFDNINCKPNHLSVMSYSRQFSNFVSNRMLDYSRDAVSVMGGTPLHESAGLNEPRGLSDYDSGNNQMIVYGPIPPLILPTTGGMVIDWDLDGDTTSDSEYQTTANVNSLLGCPASGSDDALNGFDDWNLIDLRFTQSGSSYADGISTSTAAGSSGSPRTIIGEISQEGANEDKESSTVIEEINNEITKEIVIDQHVLRITTIECFLNLAVAECETPLVLRQEYTDFEASKQEMIQSPQEKEGAKKHVSIAPTDKALYTINEPDLTKIKMEILAKTTDIKNILKQSLKKDFIDPADLKTANGLIKNLQKDLKGVLNDEYYEAFLIGTDDIGKSFQIAAQLGVEHTLIDPDNDGITGRADLCPESAEDFDGVQDTDGCPDDEPSAFPLAFIIAIIVIATSIAVAMISIGRRPRVMASHT